MALNERKNKSKIKADSSTEPNRKNFISSAIRVLITVRTKGKPLMCMVVLLAASNCFTNFETSSTTAFLRLELSTSLLIRTPIEYTFESALYSRFL